MNGVDSGAGVVLGLLAVILAVAVFVWVALALSAAFAKMGEDAWRGWVPVLNIATLLRWGGFSPWLALLVLIPGVGALGVWVLLVLSIHRLNPGFGYGAGMTVVGALLFPVWATIVGFGPAVWRGARPGGARAVPLPAGGPASPLYPPFGSLATGFDAPLPPPPFPPPATATAPATARTGDPSASEHPPAAVAPQPWAPQPAPAVGSASPLDRPDAAPAATTDSTPASTPGSTPASTPASTPGDEVAGPDSDARPDPTSPTPTVRPDSGWQSDMDEVSAVAPAPFPPSTAPRAGGEVSPPVPAGTGGLIESVPGRPDEAPVMRLRRPASRADRDESDVFPELTGEVSAVVGSPAAGAPVSAASSVSAQEREREERASAAAAEPWDDELDRTVMVRRGHARWELVLPAGATVPLTADVVIVGRNPVADPSRPRAQLVAVADATRTVSKTHARLERRGESWLITDLGSTNGVLLPSLLGTDIEVDAGAEAEVSDRFLLGDAAIRLQRIDPGA